MGLLPRRHYSRATLTQLAFEISDRIGGMAYTDLLHLRDDLDTPENHALTEARDLLIRLCKDIASTSSHNA